MGESDLVTFLEAVATVNGRYRTQVTGQKCRTLHY